MGRAPGDGEEPSPRLRGERRWDPANNEFVVEPESRFHLRREGSCSALTDTLLVMCRAGGRSAKAVNALANVGFVNVYNIIDGMEGDKAERPRKRKPRETDEERLEEIPDRLGPTMLIQSCLACQ